MTHGAVFRSRVRTIVTHDRESNEALYKLDRAGSAIFKLTRKSRLKDENVAKNLTPRNPEITRPRRTTLP